MLASWVPVLLGVMTPVCFAMRGIIIRKLSDEKYGICFNISDASMTVYFLVNVVILILAIVYWVRVRFDKDMFWLGIVASMVDTVAINCLSVALDKGPMGPASALANFNTIILTVY